MPAKTSKLEENSCHSAIVRRQKWLLLAQSNDKQFIAQTTTNYAKKGWKGPELKTPTTNHSIEVVGASDVCRL